MGAITDREGNSIYRVGTSLKLKLVNYTTPRTIGKINTFNRTLVVRRVPSRHLHKKSNSYGFNYFIVSNATTFDSVVVVIGGSRYTIPNEVIIQKGSFLYFKSQGFEKQIFLPVSVIEQYKL